MKKRVLITGATGFVGRQVLSSLYKADVDLVLVTRVGSKLPLPLSSEAEIVFTKDLFKKSADWWANICQDVDVVIHTAWYTEPTIYLQSPKNSDCLAGTLQLASGCIMAGVQRFIGVGSCSEYDVSFGYLSIDTPLNPTTPYAKAKVSTFLALSKLLPLRNIEFAWARLFYLYGEGEDARRLVPYLRARLSAGEPADLTSGSQIRDYLDVADAGAQIAALGLSEVCGAVNICSGHPLTIRELAEQIADEYGRRDLLRFGVRADNQFDPPCVVGIRSVAC